MQGKDAAMIKVREDFFSYFDWMDYVTFIYNQQEDGDNRRELIKTIHEQGGVTLDQARYAARYACYLCRLLFNIYFNDVNKEDVSLDQLFKYVYDKGFFEPDTSYQTKTSDIIIMSMYNDGIIKKYEYTDCDYRQIDSRYEVYEKLLNRMQEPDFISAGVCFCTDMRFINTPDEAKHDHALIVTKNNSGMPVISDTSYRSHSWSENALEKWIYGNNIRWWTEVKPGE